MKLEVLSRVLLLFMSSLQHLFPYFNATKLRLFGIFIQQYSFGRLTVGDHLSAKKGCSWALPGKVEEKQEEQEFEHSWGKTKSQVYEINPALSALKYFELFVRALAWETMKNQDPNVSPPQPRECHPTGYVSFHSHPCFMNISLKNYLPQEVFLEYHPPSEVSEI